MSFIVALMFAFIQSIALAQKTSESKIQAYDAEPFNTGLLEVPSSAYMGHDPYSLAKGLQGRPEKDPYETSAQYQEKLDLWLNEPLYGSVRIGDTIAIHVPFLSLQRSYDADTEILTFSFDPKKVSTEDPRTPYLTTKYDKKILKVANGQTAMGVKFKYERQAIDEFGVKLDNFNIYATDPKFTIKVSPDDAKKHLLWDVLFVGKLSKPYYFSEKSYHEPTLLERYEQLVTSRGIVFTIDEIVIYTTGKNPQVITRIPLKYVPPN